VPGGFFCLLDQSQPVGAVFLRDGHVSGAVAAVGVNDLVGDLRPGVAREAPEEGLVVTLFPDSGERYLSKLNEDWMREQGLLDA
jgi:hypothetical protein